MKKLTEEQIEVFEKHKDLIMMAYNSSVVIGAKQKDLQELKNLYLDLGYYGDTNTVCPSCVIRLLSVLGSRYQCYLDHEIETVDEEPEKEKPEFTAQNKKKGKKK